MNRQRKAETIRELRGQCGWTQEELANASGMEVSTIKRYEKGERGSRPTTFERLKRPMEEHLGIVHQAPAKVEELSDRVAELEEAVKDRNVVHEGLNAEGAAAVDSVERMKARIAELEESLNQANPKSESAPAGEAPQGVQIVYYLHPYHEMICYDVPRGAPVPRVGEFVVIPYWKIVGTPPAPPPVVTYKVKRVLYAHEIYIDEPVRVEIDVANAESFD